MRPAGRTFVNKPQGKDLREFPRIWLKRRRTDYAGVVTQLRNSEFGHSDYPKPILFPADKRNKTVDEGLSLAGNTAAERDNLRLENVDYITETDGKITDIGVIYLFCRLVAASLRRTRSCRKFWTLCSSESACRFLRIPRFFPLSCG